MNFIEGLCFITVASIMANAGLHYWHSRWFAREKKLWLESNERLIEAMRQSADEDEE